MITKFKKFFAVPTDNPNLLLAQSLAFSKQVPLLYFVTFANIAFLAATHIALAPVWLTLFFPMAYGCMAIYRLIGWWKSRQTTATPQQAEKRLRSTVKLSFVLGPSSALWSLSLFPYGGPYEQLHIAFFMAITMIACAFCLMHLRAAAFSIVVLVVIPFVFHFATADNLVFKAIALNLLLVSGAMLYIVSNHYDDFVTMVNQKSNLEKTNAETQHLSNENQRLANLDSLTNLPNRRSFFASIKGRLSDNENTVSPFAVGLMDLDGFKAVNDLYGHATGDALLVEVSNRLVSTTGNRAIVARLGGDEFGLVISDPAEALSLGDAACEVLRQPYLMDGLLIEISASCGIVLYPENGRSTTELLEYADYALYQAKQNANGKAILFSSSHKDQLIVSHQVDQALRHADLVAEMSLEYQPIVNRVTGEIHQVEALARWSSKLLGQISPSQFIVAAERSNLINKVSLVLLQRLLDDMVIWPEHLCVSFNLSARSLASSDAMLRILSCVQKSNIDPRRIEFEVTETALMIDFDTALRGLGLLRNLGCSIALDDFGTGFSSLSYVHRLPLDKIKIDRRFVTNLESDQKARNIIKTIVGLTQDLKLACVAEGVETEAQAGYLQEIGCHLMQGYLFSRPGKAEAIAGLIKQADLAAKKAARYNVEILRQSV